MSTKTDITKFFARVPTDIHERLGVEARKRHCSMNTIYVQALEAFLANAEQPEATRASLERISERLDRLEGMLEAEV